jgi:putative membrane protein
MSCKLLARTAAVLSLVALAACDNPNTAANRNAKDQVVTTEPAPRSGAVTDTKDSSGPATNTPAGELTADTRDYVQKAAMGDMYEIEASKIALSRSKSPDVKRFAQQMIDAHTMTSEELKARLARAGLIVELPTLPDMEHQRKLDELKAASPQAFDALYAAQQKEAHEQAVMLHRNYAMRGTVADLKALAADTVPKIEMHVQMAAELQSGHRTG